MSIKIKRLIFLLTLFFILNTSFLKQKSYLFTYQKENNILTAIIQSNQNPILTFNFIRKCSLS